MLPLGCKTLPRRVHVKWDQVVRDQRMVVPMKMLAVGGGALADVEAKGVDVGAGSDRI
jgi:hypothetical protein